MKLKVIKWIGTCICIVAGIVLCVGIFFSGNYNPATVQDFQQLKEEAFHIRNVHDMFPTTCQAKFTVELENEKCKIRMVFDERNEVEEYKEFDKSTNPFFAMFISVLSGICAFYVSYAIWIILFEAVRNHTEKTPEENQ